MQLRILLHHSLPARRTNEHAQHGQGDGVVGLSIVDLRRPSPSSTSYTTYVEDQKNNDGMMEGWQPTKTGNCFRAVVSKRSHSNSDCHSPSRAFITKYLWRLQDLDHLQDDASSDLNLDAPFARPVTFVRSLLSTPKQPMSNLWLPSCGSPVPSTKMLVSANPQFRGLQIA